MVCIVIRSNCVSYNGTPRNILVVGFTACDYIASGFYRMAKKINPAEVKTEKG